MTKEQISDAIIEEADKARSRARPAYKWVKWGALAACVCVVIAGIMTFRQRFGERTFDYVENPVLISLDEEPRMQRDDLKNILLNNLVVYGTVRDCSYLRMEDGNSTWYITMINLDVEQMIRGEADASTLRIVSAQCCMDADMGDQFPVRAGLTDCVPGTKGVFAISSVSEDSAWDIGDQRISVKDFGDYIYRLRCSQQGNDIVYDAFSLSIDEVSNE